MFTSNTAGRLFILSLAAADCSVGLFVMIPSLVRILAGGWKWGLSVCKADLTNIASQFKVIQNANSNSPSFCFRNLTFV